MRAVFVRRRAETKVTPAWMGGLNYEEHTMPKLPWNIDKRALSSDFASALQTRVHTSQSDLNGDEGEHAQRSVLRSRPNTSGRRRLQSARARPPSSGALTDERRPQTAGAPGTQAMHRWSLHPPLDMQQLDVRLRTANAFRPATGAGSLTARSVSSADSTTSYVKAKRAKEQRFFQLQVNIVGVGGSAYGTADDDSEGGFYNACVTLAIDGTSDGAGQTHVSKPFKASQMAFVPLPENWNEFALTGNVFQMLMAVKMLRRTSDSSKAGEAGVQLGSCLLDLGAVLKAGGSKREVCKLTHDKMGRNSLEVHLDLRMHARKADFDYAWKEGEIIFKKAGYIMTGGGIQAPPTFVARKDHQRKVTKRPNITMQDLQMKECLRSDQPVIIWKAYRIDEEGEPTNETYTLKRFPVMEADPRRQLIAELDGLQEMPAHLAVQPVDAFMDRLECVLVLDNEGGNYLSESVANKGAMPERLVSIVVRQVLSALLYLQNEKMRVHNDICAANLLVLRSGEVKLGGFAFSSKAFMGHTSCRFAGNYAHMSPERLLGLECGYKADVWSVGILTLDLIIGACPYDMKGFVGPTAIFDFKRTVVEEPSPSLRRGGEHTDDVRLFVDSCLNKNLKLRAECKGLLVQEFVTKWEVLTPNYLTRWLNRTTKKKAAVSTDPNVSVEEGNSSPFRGPESPTSK